MQTYRTPGVYVEEIPVFPPSVAQVETAIPAFVGYTAFAKRLVDGDLINVPVRIKSLLEYEALFGKGPVAVLSEIVIDDDNNFVRAKSASSYYLYDSLRLFFDNGGGDCYIVSVKADGYTSSLDAQLLKGGVEALSPVDEPTLLLFPDAAALDASDLALVQQAALAQCGALGDRVAILDTRRDDPLGQSFRDNVGINHLKYGAAYSPWLSLNYKKAVGYRDIAGALKKGGATVTLRSLTSDPGLGALIDTIENAEHDQRTLASQIDTLTGQKAIASRSSELVTAYQAAKNRQNMAQLFAYVYGLARIVDGAAADAQAFKHADLRKDAARAITNSLKAALSTLIAFERELAARVTGYDEQWSEAPSPQAAEWGGLFGANAPAASSSSIPSTLTAEPAILDTALPFVSGAFAAISTVIASLTTAAASYARTAEQSLLASFGTYANLIRGVSQTLSDCPPSGAIAGVYAAVDRTRGVWKAPANVSLAGVVGPVYRFDASETDRLNVDTDAGKSINAIRAFTGRGTVVWGARTLAGNDNEWRYVSVRRFFNMVEESVKKATYWAVFEPNDANTWVKVRATIENYLTQTWRNGALVGALAKDAFYVRCGLGITMTAQDVLEGRLVVQIGMAAVRPAEFIVLQFTHLQQTS